MSEATIEAALESEAFESAGEAAYEGEAAGEAAYEGYGAGPRERQRRIMLARQRQEMLARQRQAQLRPQPARRPAITAPSQAVRAVRSEVRSLDLQTKVALDSLGSRLDEAYRVAYRNAWAAEASAAASQVLDSFENGLEPHDWARAAIRGLPTLLITPGKPRRPGFEGILYDPRVAGGALLAGIWAIGHFRSASQGVADIVINPIPPAQLQAGSPGGKLTGYAVDKNGNPITRTTISISWSSQDQNILQVATDGTFNALNAGPTLIIATGGGFTKREPVTVTPAAAPPAAPPAAAPPAAPPAAAPPAAPPAAAPPAAPPPGL